MARLVIVDDEESIGDALRQVFEYEGHDVRVARDGPQALVMVEESRPLMLPAFNRRFASSRYSDAVCA